MDVRRIVFAAALSVAIPSLGWAQSRWDKFQQRLDDMRPKGKWIQQVKESLESATPDGANGEPQAKPGNDATSAETSRKPKPARRIQAQSVSRQSILNTAKNIPSDGVVLGIQIDPNFIPAQRLVVSEIEPGSPAEQAGIRTGDQITSVGGIPTTTLKALDGILSSLNGGDQVSVEFIRNRKPQRALVRFEKTPVGDETPPSNDNDPQAVLLPPPPEMLDVPVDSTSGTDVGLRSVLDSNANPNRWDSANRRPTAPISGGSSRRSATVADQATSTGVESPSGTTAEQLRQRIREQQQIIEQLEEQLRQLEFAETPMDGSDSVILAPGQN